VSSKVISRTNSSTQSLCLVAELVMSDQGSLMMMIEVIHYLYHLHCQLEAVARATYLSDSSGSSSEDSEKSINYHATIPTIVKRGISLEC
jgi:hypothetical protein